MQRQCNNRLLQFRYELKNKRNQTMETRYQEMIEYAGHGYWEWNPLTNAISFSKQWVEMLGYESKTFDQTMNAWIDRIHPSETSSCLNALATLLNGKIDHYKHQHRMRCANGVYKWVLDQAKIVAYNELGYPCKIVGTLTDIDEVYQRLCTTQWQQELRTQACG